MENETNTTQTQQSQNSAVQNSKKYSIIIRIIIIAAVLSIILISIIFKGLEYSFVEKEKAKANADTKTQEINDFLLEAYKDVARTYISLIKDAELHYFLAQGSYTNNIADLDVEFEKPSGNIITSGDFEIKVEAPNLILTKKGSSGKGATLNMDTGEKSCQGANCEELLKIVANL